MKALQLQAINQVALVEVAEPTIGDDQMLVRTGAATLCTSDLHDIAANPFNAPLPLILGHEAAGTVVKIGADVNTFQVGDRVVTHPVHPCGDCAACRDGMAHLCMAMRHFGLNLPGVFADYFVVRRDRARLLPAEISFTVGALFEPLCVCLEALAQAHLRPAASLLIVGDGPFGVLMAHLAQQRGPLRNIVIGGHQEFRLAHAGAVGKVNTAQVADPIQALLAANQGVEYDAVILATDSKSACNEALQCVRRKGRLVIFASLLGTTAVDLMTVQIKELEIVGACNDDNRLDDALDFLVQQSALLESLVTQRFPLREFATAIQLAANAQDRVLKVALLPG